MLSILYYHGTANEINNELCPHTYQHGPNPEHPPQVLVQV